MITLKHVKCPKLPLGLGSRVRAVRNAKDGVFKEGAEGIIVQLDNKKYATETMTVLVKFDKGEFIGLDNRWWGYKEDFMVIG